MATTTQVQSQRAIGLLTTVAELPPTYKLQYIGKVTAESPLDLTVKQQQAATGGCAVPITPPATPSPLKKRYREDNVGNVVESRPAKVLKTEPAPTVDLKKVQTTPAKQTTTRSSAVVHKSSKNAAAAPTTKERRTKAVRKLKFDEETSSPVSGTIIISLEEANNSESPRESGDIDPQFNLVEVSDEVRAELAAIPNVIGAYNCKLCRLEFEDAFGLAQHRCSCIVLLEYRCPECGKRFNCPANLASHRRWHKPRDQVAKKGNATDRNSVDPECKYRCDLCDKVFKRPAYLKKHQLTHNKASKAKPKDNPTSAESARSEESSSNHSIDSAYPTPPLPPPPPPPTVFTIVATSELTTVPVASGPEDQNVYHCDPYYDGTSATVTFRPASSSGRGSEMDDEDDYEERNLVINEDYDDDDDEDDAEDEMERQIRSAYCDRFTEEENLAAAALARLRNGPSVIRHTTALVV